MTLATLLLLHGDDARMELLYFVASVLLALTPIVVFGAIGVLAVRGAWRERKSAEQAQRDGMRNSE